VAALLLALVRGYQLLISPYFAGSCRFLPSCSAYASEAIRVHGAARGTWLAMCRLGRCHPGCRAGFDPVPPAVPRRRSVRRLAALSASIGRRLAVRFSR